MLTILETIRQALAQQADPARREGTRRFFKEPVEAYGVAAPQVKTLAREVIRETITLSKEELFSLCEELWQSGTIEESALAADLAYARRNHFTSGDFAVFAAWVDKYVSNWAACDALCTRAVGACLEAFPACLKDLQKMTASKNRWTRRAAAVSLVAPGRRGLYLDVVFSIADALLVDPDDMVQKGYGWMLKSASNAHAENVFAYVMEKKDRMPRTALRYAIEKLPPPWRAQAMAK